MSSRSFVSIGLPVYNGAQHLCAAVDSLLAQDHDDFELIISDNASSDATAEICQAYAARDRRVRYVRNTENIGPNRNFLRTLELASGERFMWASHDDVWSPEYVSRLLAGFQRGSRVMLASGRTVYITEEGEASPIAPASAPPLEVVSVGDLVGELLTQQATSWFFGIYQRNALLDLRELLRDVPVWGGDVLFLMRCCLRSQVVGDDNAVIFKRLRTHTSHQPKTPRAWTTWQRIFVAGMLGEVFTAQLPWSETTDVLAHVVPYLRSMIFKKGIKNTTKMWLRAAYQFSQSRDHA